jgi:glycosyltransferase involved in cell wall biosynthesis
MTNNQKQISIISPDIDLRDGVSKHSLDLIEELLGKEFNVIIFSPGIFRLRYRGFFDSQTHTFVKATSKDKRLKPTQGTVLYAQYLFGAYWLSIIRVNLSIRKHSEIGKVYVGFHEPVGDVRMMGFIGKFLYRNLLSSEIFAVTFSNQSTNLIEGLGYRGSIFETQLSIPVTDWTVGPISSIPTFILMGYYAKSKGFESGVYNFLKLRNKTNTDFKVVIVSSLRERTGSSRILRIPDLISFRKFKKLVTIASKSIDMSFFDFVTDSELKSLLKSSHYLVLPYSEVANSGVSVLAKQYGVPVISTDLEGFRRYFGDSGTYLGNFHECDVSTQLSAIVDNEDFRKIQSEKRAKLLLQECSKKSVTLSDILISANML